MIEDTVSQKCYVVWETDVYERSDDTELETKIFYISIEGFTPFWSKPTSGPTLSG